MDFKEPALKNDKREAARFLAKGNGTPTFGTTVRGFELESDRVLR